MTCACSRCRLHPEGAALGDRLKNPARRPPASCFIWVAQVGAPVRYCICRWWAEFEP